VRRTNTTRLRIDHILCAAAGIVMLAGCSDSTEPTSSAPPVAVNRVVLIGDSLGEQTEPYLATMVGDREFSAQVFGGTAPCDWLGKDLTVTATSVAVITFTGNSGTDCMSDGAGGFLSGQALLDKYRSDITALVAQVRASGAQVLMVGQPQRLGGTGADMEVAGLNEFYAGLAEPGAVSFIDAGAAVEDANGAFTLRLPCLPNEPDCAPDGSIAVRSEDGVHFCSNDADPNCAGYSSGAFRFTAAIVTALDTL